MTRNLVRGYVLVHSLALSGAWAGKKTQDGVHLQSKSPKNDGSARKRSASKPRRKTWASSLLSKVGHRRTTEQLHQGEGMNTNNQTANASGLNIVPANNSHHCGEDEGEGFSDFASSEERNSLNAEERKGLEDILIRSGIWGTKSPFLKNATQDSTSSNIPENQTTAVEDGVPQLLPSDADQNQTTDTEDGVQHPLLSDADQSQTTAVEDRLLQHPLPSDADQRFEHAASCEKGSSASVKMPLLSSGRDDPESGQKVDILPQAAIQVWQYWSFSGLY